MIATIYNLFRPRPLSRTAALRELLGPRRCNDALARAERAQGMYRTDQADEDGGGLVEAEA